jgi:hypothetical protein
MRVSKRAMAVLLTLLVTVAAITLSTQTASALSGETCGGEWQNQCGVNANQSAGDFHGLIAVRGAPWVLNRAGHSGTTAGCGDCSWTIVTACNTESPDNPGGPLTCAAAANSPTCDPGQLLFRLYLTTDAVTDALEGTLCLGGNVQPIPISDEAAGDVQRYLRDVTPPDLTISTKPRLATLAGLPTYFSARSPSTLKPAPFGGPQVTETITIAPIRSDWRWGDGTASGWAKSVTSLTHAFAHGRKAVVTLTTRWGATYTIGFAGETFGPYDAVGQLTKLQTLVLPVHTTSPTLVSR